MQATKIEPFIAPTEQGRVSVLCIIAASDVAFSADPIYGRFFDVMSRKVTTGWAIHALDTNPRKLESTSEVDAIVDQHRNRLWRMVDHYKPQVVVVFGANTMKAINPDLRMVSNRHIAHYIHQIKSPLTQRDTAFLCMTQPRTIITNPFEALTAKEDFVKLNMLARGKHYWREGEIVDLNTSKAAEEYIDFLLEDHKGWVAYDTETRNLNMAHNNILGTMQFATDDKTGYVLYWDHIYNKRDKEHDLRVLTPKLKRLFGGKSNIAGWAMHNAQFDIAQTRNHFDIGWWSKTVFDTLLYTHHLDQNRNDKSRKGAMVYSEGGYSLKQCACEFIGYRGYDAETLVSRKDGGVLDLPYDKLTRYAGQDGFVTYRLLTYLQSWAAAQGVKDKVNRFSRVIHSGAIKAFQQITKNGMEADPKQLAMLARPGSILDVESKRIDALFKQDPVVQKINLELLKKKTNATTFWEVPWIFDIGKPASRNLLFFTSPSGRQYPKNDDGKYSCDDKFQDRYKDQDPLVGLLATYSEIQKLRSSYVNKISIALHTAKHNKTDLIDGRVHSRFLLHGTKTGRLSSVGPNMQQVPRADNEYKKPVKSIFTTPTGTIILQGDFAAAEVRMWGSLSQDAFLCKLLTDSFNKRAAYRANPLDERLRDEAELMADIHKQTASLMFGIDLKAVTKDIRTITKGITFGLIYGRGRKSIAVQLKRSEEETGQLCDKFFSQFPGGVAWLEEQKEFCKRYGFVETPFGRRRYLPWVFSEDEGFAASALRQSINTPVQSASGDFATLSIALLNEEIARKRLSHQFKLVNAVHDSTLLEIPASVDALAEATAMMRHNFTVKSREVCASEFGFDTAAPMDIDIEVSQWKAKRCPKCGNQYKFHKEKCDAVLKGPDKKPLKDSDGNDVKCGNRDFEVVKLNGGWGTLINLDETMSGYRAAALGF
jgi:DNA polymerase I-like protein with 3'-5' exonuclease and polymerase domains